MKFIGSCLTENYESRIAAARKALQEADMILVGGGAGLSAAAGIDYSGPAFQREFTDYIRRYGFTDLYTSSFYDFPSEETRWAYWAKHIDFARIHPDGLPLYRQLLDVVKEKDYFVITTNVDGQFIKAGFAPERIFEVQGDYAFIQCAKGCHPERYDASSMVKEMVANTADCAIPPSMVPHCPVCGGKMDINIRKDRYFVQDEHWYAQAEAYENFLKRAEHGKPILLEIGVGFNTPTIIRLPFEDLAHRCDLTLIRINATELSTYYPVSNYIPFSENTAGVLKDIHPHC